MARDYRIESASWRRAGSDDDFRPLDVKEGSLRIGGTYGQKYAMDITFVGSEEAKALEEWHAEDGHIEIRCRLAGVDQVQALKGPAQVAPGDHFEGEEEALSVKGRSSGLDLP